MQKSHFTKGLNVILMILLLSVNFALFRRIENQNSSSNYSNDNVTNPYDADSDHDNLLDEWEVKCNGDPNTAWHNDYNHMVTKELVSKPESWSNINSTSQILKFSKHDYNPYNFEPYFQFPIGNDPGYNTRLITFAFSYESWDYQKSFDIKFLDENLEPIIILDFSAGRTISIEYPKDSVPYIQGLVPLRWEDGAEFHFDHNIAYQISLIAYDDDPYCDQFMICISSPSLSDTGTIFGPFHCASESNELKFLEIVPPADCINMPCTLYFCPLEISTENTEFPNLSQIFVDSGIETYFGGDLRCKRDNLFASQLDFKFEQWTSDIYQGIYHNNTFNTLIGKITFIGTAFTFDKSYKIDDISYFITMDLIKPSMNIPLMLQHNIDWLDVFLYSTPLCDSDNEPPSNDIFDWKSFVENPIISALLTQLGHVNPALSFFNFGNYILNKEVEDFFTFESNGHTIKPEVEFNNQLDSYDVASIRFGLNLNHFLQDYVDIIYGVDYGDILKINIEQKVALRKNVYTTVYESEFYSMELTYTGN